MPLELTPTTEAGARLVALAETLAGDLAPCAAEHDRDGTFPHAAVARLRHAGYFAAPVPVEHGGLGADGVHDLMVAASRLARGDASLAIGVNMHLLALLNVVRRWQIARARGDARRAAAFAASMEDAARDGVVLAVAVSEHGQDLTRPATRAVRANGGWRVDGRKAFCTMSPAATHLVTSVTFPGAHGEARYGYAQIPADAPGVRIHDDWDALGMRASGSHSITLDGVKLPLAALRGGFPAGDPSGYLERNLPAGLMHAAASLGIAESAHATALEPQRARAAQRGGPPEGREHALLADSEMDLSAARGVLSRAAALIDAHHAAHPQGDEPPERVAELFAEAQAAKTVAGEACVRVVDRALALSGGAGYRSGHPLARAYRDVRAGAFMHPLGSTRAYDFVARIALGLDPDLR